MFLLGLGNGLVCFAEQQVSSGIAAAVAIILFGVAVITLAKRRRQLKAHSVPTCARAGCSVRSKPQGSVRPGPKIPFALSLPRT